MVRTSSLPLSVVLSVLLAFLLVVFVPGPVNGANKTSNGLTKEEAELVAKFRVIVKDIVYKDWMNADEYLVRWLRIRDYSLRAARDALQVAVEWRKSNNIDHILEEEFKDVEQEFTLIFEGVDKSGRPLVFFSLGSVDVRKVVISGRARRFTRFFVQGMELAQTYLRDMKLAEGNQTYQTVTHAFFVLDLSGFNLRQHACVQCIPPLLALFQMYENYYPDLAHKVYGLNTPRAFLPVADLVRPFFSEPDRRALQLFDSNADSWKKVLLNEIDADQLPTQYGGTRKVRSKTMTAIKKSNPRIKAVFERAAAASKKQTKSD